MFHSSPEHPKNLLSISGHPDDCYSACKFLQLYKAVRTHARTNMYIYISAPLRKSNTDNFGQIYHV